MKMARLLFLSTIAFSVVGSEFSPAVAEKSVYCLVMERLAKSKYPAMANEGKMGLKFCKNGGGAPSTNPSNDGGGYSDINERAKIAERCALWIQNNHSQNSGVQSAQLSRMCQPYLPPSAQQDIKATITDNPYSAQQSGSVYDNLPGQDYVPIEQPNIEVEDIYETAVIADPVANSDNNGNDIQFNLTKETEERHSDELLDRSGPSEQIDFSDKGTATWLDELKRIHEKSVQAADKSQEENPYKFNDVQRAIMAIDDGLPDAAIVNAFEQIVSLNKNSDLVDFLEAGLSARDGVRKLYSSPSQALRTLYTIDAKAIEKSPWAGAYAGTALGLLLKKLFML